MRQRIPEIRRSEQSFTIRNYLDNARFRVTAHPSFLRKQESIRMVLPSFLRKQESIRMVLPSFLRKQESIRIAVNAGSPDGFLRKQE
jgi:hypothetical protein